MILTFPVPPGFKIKSAFELVEMSVSLIVILSIVTPPVNVFVPDMVWVLVVKTCKSVDAPAADLNRCTRYALTKVDEPLVLDAFNATVVPDNVAVNVN